MRSLGQKRAGRKMRIRGRYSEMTTRIPICSNRWLIPNVALRIALARYEQVRAEALYAVVKTGSPECRVIGDNSERFRYLQIDVRTNLDHVQGAVQVDRSLTEVDARRE